MTPRTLVDWWDINEPLERAWADTADSVHSYYPVCRGSMDDVVGVASLKEVARRWLAGENAPLIELALPPLFLPEQLAAYRALEQFKQASPLYSASSCLKDLPTDASSLPWPAALRSPFSRAFNELERN